MIDPVAAIYSNSSIDDAAFEDKDPYNVQVTNFPDDVPSTYLEEIKVLVPEGFRDVLSLDTNRNARICVGQKGVCKTAYRVKIRGMLTKIPGWFFTAYQSAQFFSQQLISEPQMVSLLKDFFSMYLNAEDNYNDMIASYNFTNDIPKYKMFVRLSSNITDERREFIADGIRSYFRDDRTILLDLSVSMKAVTSSLALFQIFVAIVGVIALTLAFFLLLISTT